MMPDVPVRRLVGIRAERSTGMARATGLEPATSGVTGRHSNQLSYARTAWSPRRGVSPGDGAGFMGRYGTCQAHPVRIRRPRGS